MTDFLAKFKRICATIDAPPVLEPPKDAEPAPEPIQRRYNIHKRSLPVGIDKIVFFNLKKAHAEKLVSGLLKTKIYHNAPDENTTLIYFDIVPVNATPRERSIYYNMGPVTREE